MPNPFGDVQQKDYVFIHRDARANPTAAAYRAAGYTIDGKYAAGDVPASYAADVLQPGSVHLYK